jgi:hypothetical protein
MAAHRMSRYEPFVGVWNTTGNVLDTDLGPAGTLLATDTYAWLPGKHFMVHHVDAHFDAVRARSMEVMGYDGAGKRYFARSFDDQGATELFDIALKGRRWLIAGQKVRFAGAFDERWNCLTGLWEAKGKRGRWQPWIRLRLARA